jgi:hypothetical protein
MSGASGIAAAKNRRGKETFSRFPQNNQTCAAKGGGCPRPGSATPQNISRASPGQTQSQSTPQYSPFLENKMVDPVTLRVTGPMQPLQIIQIHEQRLNKFDVRFEELRMTATATALCTPALCTPALCTPALSTPAFNAAAPSMENCNSGCNEECANRINDLEDKVNILEEVILNLQLTLANVQNFAMETNLALMKFNNTQAQAPVTPSLPILVESTLAEELTTPLNLLEIESITMEITDST